MSTLQKGNGPLSSADAGFLKILPERTCHIIFFFFLSSSFQKWLRDEPGFKRPS